MNRLLKNKKNLIIMLFFVCLFMSYIFKNTLDKTMISFSAFFVILLLSVAFLNAKKEKNYKKQILVVSLIAFIIRLLYILYTPWNYRQHDAGSLENANGHSGYMLYLLNNMHLPDFDPTSVWQFYHPPLHHFLAAIWMFLHKIVGFSITEQLESVQFLTLFYSYLCAIIIYKILNEINFEKTKLIIVYSLIVFAPVLIMMSGQINNDQLSIVFMLLIILWTIKWIKDNSLKNIIPIALSFGFGMLSKLSVASLAFPVGIIFAFFFFKSIKHKDFMNYIKQYTIFILICAPLGLWWSVRCFVLYKMPFGYVPRFPDDSWMFVGQRSVLGRLLKFITYSIYMDGDPLDFNPTIGLLKTWVFEEYGFSYNPFHYLVSYPLFTINLLVVIVGIINFINCLRERKYKNMVAFFLGITLIITMISYYVFCFNFPHACTMNIRYAFPIILITDILFAYKYDLNNDIIKKYKRFLAISYCLLSMALFLFII